MEESIKLKGTYEDFIGTYENILDFNLCDEIIHTFDYYHDMDAVFCEDKQFENSNAGRFDWAIDLGELGATMKSTHPQQIVNNVLKQCLDEYMTVFGHLKPITLYSINQKVQKTPAGGGYHVWHDENSAIQHSSRVAVWMFYLNDDFEGGETEFLYYKKRINPSKGTLLIWPAGLTHAHRGGLVLKGTKYVITGWFYVG
jgi:hypothetical protein